MRSRTKLKIGYVIKYFHPIKGGAEQNFLNLALEAHADGNEVHVFTSDRKYEQIVRNDPSEYKGIRIHRSRMFFDLSLYFAFYPGMLFQLLRTDLDVVHASGFGIVWQDIILMLKKLFSRNTVFINTPHGPFMALGNYSLFLNVVRKVYFSIQRLFLNWLYDFVIEVNTFQWQWIVTYGIEKQKIKFVPNGISEEDAKRKLPMDVIERFERKYNLSGKFVISSLGRISEYKGIQHVINVLPELIKVNPDIVFLIMGRDDGYVQTLKALSIRMKLREYVRFIIDVSEEEKYAGLEVSKIFVFPSKWEAFGIVLVEAMTRRNAVVSTRTEGGKFLISDGVNGFLYNFGDTKALLQKLTQLVRNNVLASKMAQENLELMGKYVWKEIYQKHYKKLLEENFDKN